jgi:hypothetical protein
MSETEFPNSWDFTPEQRAVLQEAFDNDPTATMSAIAHAAGNVAFQQAAQLSAHQTGQVKSNPGRWCSSSGVHAAVSSRAS